MRGIKFRMGFAIGNTKCPTCKTSFPVEEIVKKERNGSIFTVVKCGNGHLFAVETNKHVVLSFKIKLASTKPLPVIPKGR